MKPRLLDLFCGAGGASMGYHRAGFEVVGVDVKPQPRYPFTFVQDDALALLSTYQPGIGWWDEPPFDAIHASPPCQAWSQLVTMRTDLRDNGAHDHPELVEPTREYLEATGLPYVIENVPGAPLINAVTICGGAAGLPVVETMQGRRRVRRHRLFETNWPLMVPPCDHSYPSLGVYGNGGHWKRTGDRRGGYQGSFAECRIGMEMDWTTRAELAQAIPPAYTEIIGQQLLALIGA